MSAYSAKSISDVFRTYAQIRRVAWEQKRIVSERRHDDLVDALATAFDRIRVGDPFVKPIAFANMRNDSVIARKGMFGPW